jgi:hypothetical protein
MNEQQLKELLNELAKQHANSEWLEFKFNFYSEQEINYVEYLQV